MEEDLTVSQLPAAEKLEDGDLMVMESATGVAQHLTVAQLRQAVTPSEALALVRQLLGKAVYTEDVTADLAALDALLGGGELPDEPDTPVVPPEEPDEPDEPVVPPDEPETDSGLELIAMYTLPEDVISVTIDKDDNGQPFELDEAWLMADIKRSTQNAGNGAVHLKINGSGEYPAVMQNTLTSSEQRYIFVKFVCGDVVSAVASAPGQRGGMDASRDSLVSVTLEGVTAGREYFGAESIIALYGHRKET